ncbi:MAG: LptF/LptG family permease, partial [Chitinophagaceae bacterium]|nr:LptF/LptG family permease [Chitinophagaceae bacterium]
KEKDDSTIRNIVIFERKYGTQDNIIAADSGIMKVTADKKFLEFILKDGWRYEEKGQGYDGLRSDYVRLGFKEYKKIFDLSALQMSETADSSFRYDPKMLTIQQLNDAIDSFKTGSKKLLARDNEEIATYLPFTKFAKATVAQPPKSVTKINPFNQLIPDSIKSIVYDNANSQLNIVNNLAAIETNDYTFKDKSIRFHEIEWHRKFTLSAACIVLFLIGAPLGSIIRKGGLGLPLVFSIIFFIIFHLFNTFGEKFVKESVTSSFTGMWLSTMILIPIGFFLTYKAMRDSQLFNKEFYYRAFKGFRNLIHNFRKQKNNTV